MAAILIAGESWTTHTIHIKGFDSFTTSGYDEGVGWLRAALTDAGHTVRFMPNHEANAAFPTDAATLAAYDVVILSDIGTNTLLLHPQTFAASKSLPNRLALIRDFVAHGGALIMMGGYLSFAGIDGKARYGETPIEDCLPVTIALHDDRVEAPEGVTPTVVLPDHPLMAGLEPMWPPLLGYNRIQSKSGATVVARVGNDPLMVVGTFGQGRAMAFASDCGPHWAPPGFVAWPGYARLWANAIGWLTGKQ